MWNKVIDKLFCENAYGIAVRNKNAGNVFYTKYPSFFEWYADPFVFHYNGLDYIFAETLNYHDIYGKISAARIEDGRIGRFRTVIKEPFHMSFPNIFSYHNQIYIIPETKQKGEVRLYKCVKFPYKWKLDAVLLSDVRLTDPVLFFFENTILMICFDSDEKNDNSVRSYIVDIEKKQAQEVKLRGRYSNERAGGSFFYVQGKKYRAIQNCTNVYGEYIKIYEIDAVSENELFEHQVKEIHAADLVLDKNKNVTKCHTYNANDYYEVLDFNYRKIYVNKVFMRLWQKVLLRGRTRKKMGSIVTGIVTEER